MSKYNVIFYNIWILITVKIMVVLVLLQVASGVVYQLGCSVAATATAAAAACGPLTA